MMQIKLLTVCWALFFVSCAANKNRTRSGNSETVHFQNLLESEIHPGQPLPALINDEDQFLVAFVDFGSNFPLKCSGTDNRVCVIFKEKKMTLFLIVPDDYTQKDVRNALTKRSARPVIVKAITTVS